jgi:N-acetylneuraminic acid mutarotase
MSVVSVYSNHFIPFASHRNTMAEGPDGHSLVMFGGWHSANNQITFFQDVWQLDTCSMGWTQQKTSGTAPSARGGHQAIRVGNYMIIMGGMYTTQESSYTALMVTLY